jgi:hypothetical protein
MPIRYRTIVFCTFSCCIYLLLFSPGFGEDVIIVQNQKSDASISVPADASKQVLDAAKSLAEYIEKSSGAKLPVGRDMVSGKNVVIHVGIDRYVQNLKNLDFKNLDDDGFVTRFPDQKNIVIAGPTDWGTEFGVDDFLERYVGVRWLMPGEDGEDVPFNKTLRITVKDIRDEPAFFSRQLSAPNGPGFVRKNRLHSRVEFHHNLLRLFPPSKYGKMHPEFYPIWDGKRYIPPTYDDWRWQPCFSADGIIEEAVRNIKDYFKANPSATSYSLGMNDSDRFCQCEKCLAKEDKEKNFLGYRNYSDIYFEWANKVVEEVLKEYPDKWFGTLAYWNLAQPPKKVKVHPRIIPYMTYDRMHWIDPDLEAEGHRITEWWKSMSPTLGWYDYIYGTPYLLPRVYFHEMGKYLQYGYKAGVRVSYAEIYYNWGEGPKEYIHLKLLWNPRLDINAALNEWYERAVGKEAAPELAAYYTLWEKFWTGRIQKSSWYTPEGQFMRFTSPGYLDIVTRKDIAKSRTWLENAMAKAHTVKQKKRAGLLLKAFEYYEASAYSFLDEWNAFNSYPKSGKEALGLLDTAEEYASMKEKRFRRVEEFNKDPVLNHPGEPMKYRSLMGDLFGCYPLWAVYAWGKNDGSVKKKIASLASSKVQTVSGQAKLMTEVLNCIAEPISANASFEASIEGWKITLNGGKGLWTGASGHKKSGSLLVTGIGTSILEQKVPIPGDGTYTCLAFVKAEGALENKGSVELTVSLDSGPVTNSPWAALQGWHSTSIKPQTGVWIPAATTVETKALSGGEPALWDPDPGQNSVKKDGRLDIQPKFLVIRLTLRNFEKNSHIYIDDFGLYRQE